VSPAETIDRAAEWWHVNRPWSARLDRYGRTVLSVGRHGCPPVAVATVDQDLLGGSVVVGDWRFTWDGAGSTPRRRRRTRKETA